MDNVNFEEIRPYNNQELPLAIERIVQNPYFPKFFNFVFQNTDIEIVKSSLQNLKTIKEFQVFVMKKLLENIVKSTSSGFTNEGFEKLNDDKKCMFISNHRDIILDAALLQPILYSNGLDTCEITFGSNLMSNSFFNDIGKINKMFTLFRGGTPKELFNHSMQVSNYMRYAITEKSQSIWIAQRNGRTKNGDDKTEVAVLKMFAMSSKKDFVDNLEEINITPIAVSYEYESCDFLKTRELYITKRQKYVKVPGEDFNSIMQGVKQWKGGIHFVVCDSITHEELTMCNSLERNEKFARLAQIIDQWIYANYRLWKTNYIAYDLLNKTNDYQSFYTKEERNNFLDYAKKGLQPIEGDSAELMEIFLGIYANPVKNHLSLE